MVFLFALKVRKVYAIRQLAQVRPGPSLPRRASYQSRPGGHNTTSLTGRQTGKTQCCYRHEQSESSYHWDRNRTSGRTRRVDGSQDHDHRGLPPGGQTWPRKGLVNDQWVRKSADDLQAREFSSILE